VARSRSARAPGDRRAQLGWGRECVAATSIRMINRPSAELGRQPALRVLQDAWSRSFQDRAVSPRMVKGRSISRLAQRVASVVSCRPA